MSLTYTKAAKHFSIQFNIKYDVSALFSVPLSSIMQPNTLTQGYSVMITNGTDKTEFTHQVRGILAREPGLSVKELAERLKTNRQFMAGVLRVLEEREEVSHRQVGPARIYFVRSETKRSKYK